MNKSTEKTGVTTIVKGTNVLTSMEVLKFDPAQQQAVVDGMHRAARVLVGQPGFIAVNVHRSLDGTHVISYIQWESEALFTSALQAPAFQQQIASYRDLVLDSAQDVYDIVYTDDHTNDGVTTISKGNKVATFINVMTTTPERQPSLLKFVIDNDSQVFAGAPGYQSANFHRGHSGTHVVNYSHWDSEQAFLDAINGMFKIPGLTMERANQMATAQADGIGSTDFRFYTVTYSAHA